MALRKVGPAAFPAIEAGLSDPSPAVRRGAVEVPVRMEAIEALRKAAGSPDPEVRKAADRGLKLIGMRKTIGEELERLRGLSR
jgi:HEAT repeat protein